MANKILGFCNLIRLSRPNGIFLLYIPCAFGIFLGSNMISKITFDYLFLFFIGAFLMRSAGCIINDLLDRKIDQFVDRTKNRPLVTGLVSTKEAIIYLLILLFLSFLVLINLPLLAIKISLFSIFLVVLYPLMKRVTFFPQLFLGITYNIGLIIGYITVSNSINSYIFFAYIGFIFWTLFYDTIYGFLDIEDDKKIGVKSLAILLENKNYKFYFYLFGVLFCFLSSLSQFLIKPGNYVYLNIITTFLMLYLTYSLNIKSKNSIMNSFNKSTIIGIALLIPQFFYF